MSKSNKITEPSDDESGSEYSGDENDDDDYEDESGSSESSGSSDDEEEEPKLKYMRLGSSVIEILKEDTATCMAVHEKFLVFLSK